ncbi:MAG: hypothetical protein QOH73_2422 [Gaiellaceae bacterium]|nr:hypothetical protein [Gaiellaceae bacterium]
MPRLRRLLRRDPIAIALTAYDFWRRLPPKQRKRALKLARKHGPRLAVKAIRLKTRKPPR